MIAISVIIRMIWGDFNIFLRKYNETYDTAINCLILNIYFKSNWMIINKSIKNVDGIIFTFISLINIRSFLSLEFFIFKLNIGSNNIS